MPLMMVCLFLAIAALVLLIGAAAALHASLMLSLGTFGAIGVELLTVAALFLIVKVLKES